MFSSLRFLVFYLYSNCLNGHVVLSRLCARVVIAYSAVQGFCDLFFNPSDKAVLDLYNDPELEVHKYNNTY